MKNHVMRKLRSVGIQCFLEYFYDFYNEQDNALLIKKLREEKGYTINSCQSRVSKSKSIINNKDDLKTVLEYILIAEKISDSLKEIANNIKNKLYKHEA